MLRPRTILPTLPGLDTIKLPFTEHGQHNRILKGIGKGPLTIEIPKAAVIPMVIAPGQQLNTARCANRLGIGMGVLNPLQPLAHRDGVFDN